MNTIQHIIFLTFYRKPTPEQSELDMQLKKEKLLEKLPKSNKEKRSSTKGSASSQKYFFFIKI